MPDSKRFVSGGQDRNLYMMDIEGKQIRSWPCPRITDLAISGDGKRMVVSCDETTIKIYDLESESSDPEAMYVWLVHPHCVGGGVLMRVAIWIRITERDTIHSLYFSQDNRHVLVGVVTKEINLYDIDQCKMVQKYFRGSNDKARFVLRSCFGGVEERFVASGSEGIDRSAVLNR
jgi:WD repeat-containing protein 26